MLPSSIDPYISRDFVAYKNLVGDSNFVSKRPGAMACKVDKTNDWRFQNYDGTMTNIISSCVYTLNDISDDPEIWTKKQCETVCGKINDKTQ